MINKLIPIILLSVLFISCKSKKTFPETHQHRDDTTMSTNLDDIRKMAKAGKHKEALDRFIWFDDHILEHNRSMEAVRLSFALAYWKELADVYQPAMDSLIERRDRKTDHIITNGEPFNFFADIVALNRTLEENSRSIILFETLDQKFPSLAKYCWYYIEDLLFEEKKYDLIHKYLNNPKDRYANIQFAYNEDASLFKSDSLFQVDTQNVFVEKCLQLINYCLFIQDLKSAKEIQNKALGEVADDRLRISL